MAYVNYFPNDGHCKHFKQNCAPCQKLEDSQDDWGTFEYRSDGRYTRGTAVKIYTTKAKAQAANAKDVDGSLVVRPVRKE